MIFQILIKIQSLGVSLDNISMIINLICRSFARKLTAGYILAPAFSYFYDGKHKGYNFSFLKKNASPKKGHLSEEGHPRKLRQQKDDIFLVIRECKFANPDADTYIQTFSETCKKLSNHYRQQTHHIFVNLKEDINQIVFKMHQLDVQNLTFIQFLNILDFFRIVTKIDGLNADDIEKSKSLLFSIMSRYIRENPELQPLQAVAFFSKLAPLNYPEFQKLSQILLDHLQKMIQQEGTLSFPPFQHFLVVKAISKKLFLTSLDIQIIKIILKDLNQKQLLDKMLMISLFKAIIDLNPKAVIADDKLLNIIDNISQKIVQQISYHKKLNFLVYLHECPANENRYFYILIKILYHRIFTQLQNNPSQEFLIFITGLTKHLKPEDIQSQKYQVLVLKYIENLQKKKQNILALEYELTALINAGFFHSEIKLLNKFMNNPALQVRWALPYSYSRAGFKFPTSWLLSKGQDAIIFRKNVTFIKAAVVIGIQFRLQSDCVQLKSLYQRLVENIRGENWNSESSEWLVKVGQQNSQLIRDFRQYYGHLFQHKINPLIQTQRNSSIDDRQNALSYWNYLFLTEQFNEHFLSQIAYSLPLQIACLCSMQEYSRKQLTLDFKPFLLSTLYIKCLQMPKSTQSTDKGLESLLNLLSYYSQLTLKSDQVFIQLYFKGALYLCKNYLNIKKGLQLQANYIFMYLLTIQNKKIRNSKWRHQLVKELNRNTVIFSQQNRQDHVQNGIIRAGLQKNVTSEFGIKYAKTQYFSLQEQSEIKALRGELEQKIDHFLPLLKKSHISQNFIKINQEQIKKIITTMTLQELQQSLIQYSFLPSDPADNILLQITQTFTEKITEDTFDFIGVISNIHEKLYRVSPETLQNLLERIVQIIKLKLDSFFLADHSQLMNYLNRYCVPHQEYAQKVFKYALENEKRGTSLIDLILEISKNSLLPDPKLELIQQISILNLEKYLNILFFYEEKVSVKPLLVTAVKKQIEAVPDSHIVRYIEKKYTITIQKRVNEDCVFRAANDYCRQMMIGLGERAQTLLKVQEVGNGQVYLLGNTAMLIFRDYQRDQSANNTKKVLSYLFPGRKLIVKMANPTKEDAQNLLHQLCSDWSLSLEVEKSILKQMRQS